MPNTFSNSSSVIYNWAGTQTIRNRKPSNNVYPPQFLASDSRQHMWRPFSMAVAWFADWRCSGCHDLALPVCVSTQILYFSTRWSAFNWHSTPSPCSFYVFHCLCRHSAMQHDRCSAARLDGTGIHTHFLVADVNAFRAASLQHLVRMLLVVLRQLLKKMHNTNGVQGCGD